MSDAILPIVFESKPKRVLDLGGNTGKWALYCSAYDPNVRVTILDHPEQLALALQNAVDENCADRITGQAIDFLDAYAPLAKGFDVVWSSQFLDCFGEDEIISILTRTRNSLAVGGSLFILEIFWDRQRYDAAGLQVETEAVVTLFNATVFATITRFAADIDSHRIRCRQKACAGPHERH